MLNALCMKAHWYKGLLWFFFVQFNYFSDDVLQAFHALENHENNNETDIILMYTFAFTWWNNNDRME